MTLVFIGNYDHHVRLKRNAPTAPMPTKLTEFGDLTNVGIYGSLPSDSDIPHRTVTTKTAEVPVEAKFLASLHPPNRDLIPSAKQYEWLGVLDVCQPSIWG